MKQPAVSLDRDGTIIEDPGYIADFAQVYLSGDSPSDVEAGRRAVCRTILMGPGRHTLREASARLPISWRPR